MFRTDIALKETYAEHLRKEGQGVSIDVPADEYGGTIDVLTEREIIFCALELTTERAIALKSQLNFYGKFAPSRKKVAVVQGAGIAGMLIGAAVSSAVASTTPWAYPGEAHVTLVQQ